MEKSIPHMLIAELSALYEISSLSFSGSEENLVKEAMEKAVRLFSVHYFVLLTGPEDDRQLVASCGFRNPEDISKRIKQNQPNQFYFSFGDQKQQTELFMEQAHPIGGRERRLYTVFARQLENALLTARDVTERRKTEQALQESEDLFKSLYAESPMGIGFYAVDGKLQDANEAYLKIFGIQDASELEGVSLFEDPNFPRAIKDKIRQGETVRLETAYSFEKVKELKLYKTKKTGAVYLNIAAAPVGSIREKSFLGYLVQAGDITGRKEAEEELKASQLHLIQSEKLAVMGELAAGVAHEINNPLFVIAGEAEMLLEDKNKDQETKEASKTILEQTKKMKDISSRLLGFSQIQKTEERAMDINQVVNESLKMLRYQSQVGRIKITAELEPNLPSVLGDPGQIEEVFLNIMLNAVQVMGEKGDLTIRTQSKKLTKLAPREGEKFKAGEKIVAIEIKDTGPGMDEATLKKLFSPFFTTKKGGAGLGLSVSRRIIENHNGLIEAYSKLGEGSAFVIKLPIHKEVS